MTVCGWATHSSWATFFPGKRKKYKNLVDKTQATSQADTLTTI